jgi:hypothetical protein
LLGSGGSWLLLLFLLGSISLTLVALSFETHHAPSSNRSVFVGADKVTGEIVALKRINTEAEENGFPSE